MIAWFTRILGDTTGTILSPSEVLLILIIGVALSFLFVSGMLATGAVALRAHRSQRLQVRRERFERWKRALHAVLYDEAARDALWDLVDQDSALDFLHFLVEHARRLHGDERAEIGALAEPHLRHVIRFLDHRSETRRARAVQTLGELGLPRHGQEVIAALDDPSPMVAMVAANTLARAETPEYAVAVLARLDRFSYWRQDFLVAMVASMGAGAAPALRATLADAKAPSRVRAVAADALAMLSDPAAADHAAATLAASDDVELRAACVRVLASVGRATHLEAVRQALSAELPVRLAAIRALGRFGTTTDLVPLAAAAKEDPSPWVAIAAARALKEGGGTEVLEELAGSEHPRAALGLQVISEARSW